MKNTAFKIVFAFLFGSISLIAWAKPKPDRPKNIIFLIGDGMGLTQIFAGLTMNGGWLFLEQLDKIGFSKTQSSDNYVTDSAAGATAFSIGEKTFNGAIGVDSLGQPKETILEMAEKKGLSTGLVTTCDLTHATPASFAAHVGSRKQADSIAIQMAQSGVDVMIGGGLARFKNRADGLNLVQVLEQKGVKVMDSTQDFRSVKSGKMAWFGGKEHLPSILQGRDTSYLKDASLKAVELLSQNPKGFFLMIEGSQIDWGGHNNDAPYVGTEMIDFDRTIGAILAWAKKDGETLVVITADHETGGLALNGGSFAQKSIDAKFTTGGHTAVMVPVFAYGPGSKKFTGIYENTEIFKNFKKLLIKKK